MQTESIDESMLQSATQEVNRVIKRLEGINGEICVNFTFDRYDSYRAIYLPGTVGGDIYKFAFYESYMRTTSGDVDIPLRFGTNIQPLQMGNQTNVLLEDLLEDPEHSYVSKLTVYSNQNFGVASRLVEGEYKVFVFMATDTVFYSADDDEGQQLLFGDSLAPSIHNATATPAPQDITESVNITVDMEGDHLTRVFYSLEDPEGDKQTFTMIEGQDMQYYHEMTYDLVGDYSYKVWATDVFSRAASTDEWQTITIVDLNPPEFSDASINKNPQESGERVIFYMDATDDDEVSEVHIDITKSGETTTRHTMTHTTGDEWTYSKTITAIGTYSFVFSAVDPSGNWGTSVSRTFKIQDTTAPAISSISASPNPGNVNETVTFSATVTDLNDVEYVHITISGTTYNMVHVSGGLYSFDMVFSTAGPRHYKITAMDFPDNIKESILYSVTIS